METILLIPGVTAVILVLILRLDSAILALFALLVPLNWLARTHIGPLSALDYAAMIIPLVLILKTFFAGKNIFRELNKDLTIQLFYIMLFLLFLSGMLPIREIDYSQAIQDWAKFVTGFIIFFVISANISDAKKADKLLSIIPLSLLVPGTVFFWQLMTGSDLVMLYTGNRLIPNSYFLNPHMITYATAMIFPAVYYNILMSSKLKNKCFWILMFTLMLVLTYFSYARTAWIGIFAELVAMLFLMQRKKVAMLIGLMVIPIALPFLYKTIITNLSDIPTFFVHISDVFKTDHYDYLFSGRWTIFRKSLLGLYSGNPIHIIIGYGIGGTAFLTTGASYGAAHSTYITLLCDFGLINMSIFMTMMVLLFYKSYQLTKRSNPYLKNIGKVCIITIIGYLTIGIGTHFIYFLISGGWLFWGICGVMLGVYCNADKIEGNYLIKHQAKVCCTK